MARWEHKKKIREYQHGTQLTIALRGGFTIVVLCFALERSVGLDGTATSGRINSSISMKEHHLTRDSVKGRGRDSFDARY